MINKKYNIKNKLGSGRSDVYLCEDIYSPGKDLAIKILPLNVNEEEASLFREEYFILTKLNHPNIIKARETGVIVIVDPCGYEIAPGSLFITMEYFPGESLENYTTRSEEELISIVSQIASVLYYLHQSNYIYYDLKPENILISNVSGEPFVELIDLGLARHSYNAGDFHPRGTREYIAPELLSTSDHDHRVDLYSLGMLMYRLVYNKLPFDSKDDLEIYKSHLAGNFQFPQSPYSDRLTGIVKKLLSKEPSDRFYTILEMLHEFKIPVEGLKKDWVPAKTFTGRKDVLSLVNTFINRQSDGEVLSFRGTEGAGKTSVLEEIYHKYNRVVYLYKSGNEPLWRNLLRQLLYSDFIYNELDNETICAVQNLIDNGSGDLIDSIKSFINKISKENQFIILLDEYNKLDEFNLEILKEIIPVFQVNNIKLILTEDSSTPYLTVTVNNLIVVNLTPFTEANLIEYIDKSFAEYFPKQDTKKIIMLYADMLPGSINSFIRDLVLLDILEFQKNTPLISTSSKKLKLLSSSQDVIYNHQVKLLSEDEYRAAELLSLFEIAAGEDLLRVLLQADPGQIDRIVQKLGEKNVLSPAGINNSLNFTSAGLKKYIYSSIPDKKKYHFETAQKIEERAIDFNRVELARLYELAGSYNRTHKLLRDESESAGKMSAYSYRKKILQHILKLPLSKKNKSDARYELCKTLFMIGDKKSSLEIIDGLLLEKLSQKKEEELIILKGKCLINTGSPAEGIKILNNMLPVIKHDTLKEEVLIDIAAAEIDLNNYDKVTDICLGIVNNNKTGDEIKGKAFNLLALVDIYKQNDIDSAIDNFKNALGYYEKAGLPENVLGIEINLGNIFFMKHEHKEAEAHWQNAQQINLNIGNLTQDARLLLNYGNYYYDREDFEKAIENYKGANSILASLGDRNLEGMVLINLGETYISICNYQDAYEALKSAKKMFTELKNIEEESEAIFMLARLYYVVGAYSGLAEMIAEYKSLSEQKLNDEKHSKNLELLRLMELISLGEYSRAIPRLFKIKDYYFESESRGIYSATIFVLAESLLQQELYDECRKILEDDKIITLSGQYKMVNAERLYYLGKLAEQSSLQGLKQPGDYFEEAYSLIEEQSITSLTLKILFSRLKLYTGRGIMNKAEEIVVYVKAIIEFITESIQDNHIRQAFFSKPERKIMLDYISNIEAG